MQEISIHDRLLAPEAEQKMRGLLDGLNNLDEDALKNALNMLSTSRSFASFLQFVRERGDEAQKGTRLIQAGTEDRDRDDYSDRVGFHSLWSPIRSTRDAGYMLLGGVTQEGSGIFEQDQKKLVTTLFPKVLQDTYSNKRLNDQQLENTIGLHSGFIHFFLADNALANIEGIALAQSYTSADDPSITVTFTMHEKFSFVCRLEDLSSWLKTHDARLAFDRKIRIEGHKYSATEQDWDEVQPQRIVSIQEFVVSKIRQIPEPTVDKLASSYLSTLDKATQAPHVRWKLPPASIMTSIKEEISRVMDSIK